MKNQDKKLFSCLALMQYADFGLTRAGLVLSGHEGEGNALIVNAMEAYGTDIGLALFKLFALLLVFLLSKHWEKIASAITRFSLKTALLAYAGAVLSWTFILTDVIL